MVNCCVVGCKSRTKRKYENITFHTFPKDETVRNVWIAATGRQNWQPTQYTRMCSIHFKADCFQKKQQKIYLAKYSIPTLAIHIASSGDFHPHVSKGDPSILKCAYKSSLEYENEPSTSKSMHSKHMDCQIETVVVIKATCKKYLIWRIHYTTKSMVNKGEYARNINNKLTLFKGQ